jgi:SAM-dependent methyltransferase
MADHLAPDHWQHIDASESGATATDYLEAAAATIEAPRIRSHQVLGVEAGGTVLDVGCGTGIALREIADLVGRNGTVVGLDASTAMLEQARARLVGAPARVELVEGTATSTGLEHDRFDAVPHRARADARLRAGRGAGGARASDPAGGRIVLVEPDHRRLAPRTPTRPMSGFGP